MRINNVENDSQQLLQLIRSSNSSLLQLILISREDLLQLTRNCNDGTGHQAISNTYRKISHQGFTNASSPVGYGQARGTPLATHTAQRTNNMDHKVMHKFSASDAAKLRLSAFVGITDGDTELSVHLGQEQVLAAVCEYVKDSRWTGNGKERLESISKAIDETRAEIAESAS